VRIHARAIVATDLCTVVTARFQVLYVLVVMEIGSRRILHANVTAHPTSAWVAQQLRQAIRDDHAYRFLLHDRDAVFSADADRAAKAMGLRVLRSPVRAPRANAFVERLHGTLRRECLDWLIPLNERHVRLILREWVEHYNHGRPHSSLGPGIPDPPDGVPAEPQPHRYRLPPAPAWSRYRCSVGSTTITGSSPERSRQRQALDPTTSAS